MEFRADLRCMVCSHFLGEVSGVRAGRTNVSIRKFVAGPHYGGPAHGAPTRCDKCNGHLYLDEVELMRGFASAEEAAAA
ncbi:MAG: hypothetical protein ACRDHX_17195 [Chloroflexota bacterium]